MYKRAQLGNMVHTAMEKKILIGAFAIIIMLSAVPAVMASQGYWTANDSSPQGLKSYHIFLVGTYPPSTDFSGYKLVNQNLTVCLDFNANWTNPKPAVCHPIKESEIPLKNDSVIDAGFFVVPRSLNESAARACVHVGYRNLYSCGQNSPADPESVSISKLFYDLSDLIYLEARNYDNCIHDHPEDDLDWCLQQVS